jgi:hypothetical protein
LTRPSLPAQSPAPEIHVHPRAQPASVDAGALMPSAFGAVGQITVIDPDDPAAAGSTGLIADAGHQHAWTCATCSALTKTSTSTEGSASTGARSDHGHDTRNLAWGIVGRMTPLTADSTGYTGDTATDFAISNIPVDVIQRYMIHLHTLWFVSSAAEWNVNVHVNGTLFKEIGHIYTAGAEAQRLDGIVEWNPSTGTTDDIDIRVVEVQGTSTLTFIGSAVRTREFWVEGVGLR